MLDTYRKIRGRILSNGHRVRFTGKRVGYYLTKHHVSIRNFYILPFNIVIVGPERRVR